MEEHIGRPGRPRTAGVEQRVLDAATRLIAEHGLAETTLARVAAEAGISRPSIYRRWPSKEALALDVVRRALPPPAPGRPGGADARHELEMFVAGALAMPGAPPWGNAGTLLGREDVAPLVAAAQNELLGHAREVLGAIVTNGIEAGQLRSDVDVDLLADVVAGFVIRVVAGPTGLGGGARSPAGTVATGLRSRSPDTVARDFVALLWPAVTTGSGPRATVPPDSGSAVRGDHCQ